MYSDVCGCSLVGGDRREGRRMYSDCVDVGW